MAGCPPPRGVASIGMEMAGDEQVRTRTHETLFPRPWNPPMKDDVVRIGSPDSPAAQPLLWSPAMISGSQLSCAAFNC